MQIIVMDTLNMLMEGLKCTLPWSLCAWALMSLYRQARGRRNTLTALFALSYAALLLWATCASRVDSVREFLTWRLPADWRTMFVNELSFTRPAQVWHELMNVALFMPLGWLMMRRGRAPQATALITACGCALSCAVELFQGCHGLCFDLSDVMTNTLGTALGCRAYAPTVALALRARQALRRRRRAHQW